jgi:hypothetical protein
MEEPRLVEPIWGARLYVLRCRAKAKQMVPERIRPDIERVLRATGAAPVTPSRAAPSGGVLVAGRTQIERASGRRPLHRLAARWLRPRDEVAAGVCGSMVPRSFARGLTGDMTRAP